MPVFSGLIRNSLTGALYIPAEIASTSFIKRITQKNNIALTRPKIPLLMKDFEILYLPYKLATVAINSIKMKKPINILTPLSFKSLRWLLIIKKIPRNIPVNDRISIPYLSMREAWRIRLSETARKNITTSMRHADLQNFVMNPRKMKVSASTEMIHGSMLNTKGGSGKINWKTVKLISTEDKRGERKTSHLG